ATGLLHPASLGAPLRAGRGYRCGYLRCPPLKSGILWENRRLMLLSRVAYATAYAMSETRHVRLFRNGRNQAVRIPREFELPGEDAILRKEGQRLIIEPATTTMTLSELLASWEPIDEEFPEIEDPPPEPFDL